MRYWVVTWVLAAVACAAAAPAPARDAGEQTFRAALQLMCEVDERAGLGRLDDPIALGRQREDWLMSHVTNADGIYLLTVWRTQTPAEQIATLRQQARSEQLAACPLAEALEQER